MKYFGIIDKNFAAIFQLQCKIENISDMFLQYSVLCGLFLLFKTLDRVPSRFKYLGSQFYRILIQLQLTVSNSPHDLCIFIGVIENSFIKNANLRFVTCLVEYIKWQRVCIIYIYNTKYISTTIL